MRITVFLMVFILCAISPSFAVAKDTCIFSDIAAGFLRDTSVSSWTTPVTIGKPFLVYPYAIQSWNTAHSQGQALLEVDSSGTWHMLANHKSWTTSSLRRAGVPQVTAQQLIATIHLNPAYSAGCDR